MNRLPRDLISPKQPRETSAHFGLEDFRSRRLRQQLERTRACWAVVRVPR
jgi:hypothetical protein